MREIRVSAAAAAMGYHFEVHIESPSQELPERRQLKSEIQAQEAERACVKAS